jgi:hypothetical protein
MDSQSSIIYRPSSVFTLYNNREPSTSVESALQISPFMQNKANSNPIKPISNPIKANTKPNKPKQT